jgi:ABC-type branched-subunit amino acid transport system substrate-binding protein
MRRTPARWAVVCVAAALVAAGCGRPDDSSGGGGSASTPGVSDTEITIGGSYPLSGPLGPNGQAAAGGAKAVFDAVNAGGGVKMGDGKTRTIKFTYFDDGYDPAKATQNFTKLVNDNVFALFQTFGTAPNIAIMKQANARKVPQVFVHAGDLLFSNEPDKNPYTIGWQPTYESEGEMYGKYLAGQNKPLTVAVLRQADTLGQVFLQGLQEGIAGSQVKLVGTQTYVPSDPSVDAQISKLKATNADALFMAVAIPPLMISGLQHAKTLGWDPTVFMASMTSSINQVVGPGKLTGNTKLYTASFLKQPDDPQYKADPAVQEYLSRFKQYGGNANPYITNAQWGYGAAQTFVSALEQMKTVSRDSLMQTVRSMKTEVPLLQTGLSYDGTQKPPIDKLNLDHYQGGAWTPVPTG